ncbi:MAG TPA: hypothetical protein VK034_14110 [Enhygromyxa sp.]|nr:hypothetical protein [Enhygromyxa sp.]
MRTEKLASQAPPATKPEAKRVPVRSKIRAGQWTGSEYNYP